MKKTVHKVFMLWEFEKEEKWLNAMSAKGLQLCNVGFCRYTFEEGTPSEYQYRLELMDKWPSHSESVNYIRFLEDTGVENIGSMMRWVYFRKRANAGEFNLFSDAGSRIRHLNRMLFLATILAVANASNAAHTFSIWQRTHMQGNIVMMCICVVLSALIIYGVLRLFLMRHKLKKESILYE